MAIQQLGARRPRGRAREELSHRSHPSIRCRSPYAYAVRLPVRLAVREQVNRRECGTQFASLPTYSVEREREGGHPGPARRRL